MEWPAEKYLVQQLIRVLKEKRQHNSAPPQILNIGAGQSLVIENQLTKAACNYICHRVDIADCTVVHPSVEKCWRCSVELMSPVRSNAYVAAFANYVIEHVPNLNKAAHEIYRVLKPSGIFFASIPNPTAPEMLLAKRTPLWFHKAIRHGQAWQTYYAYNTIRELTEIFELAGFRTIEIRRYAFVEGYLARFPLFVILARFYDKIVSAFKIKRLMNTACVIFEKAS